MITLAGYYLIMALFFLAIAAFNAYFWSTYSADKCIVSEVVEADGVTTTTNTTKQVTSSIQLTKLALGLAISYAALMLYTLIAVCGLRKFQGVKPDRFSKLGCCLGLIGCFVRNFTFLLKVLHMIVGVLIIVQFILIYGTVDCQNAKHYTITNIQVYFALLQNNKGTVGEMQKDGELTNIVTIFAWIFFHFICPCMKRFIEIQAYIYEPLDTDKSSFRRYCCEYLGP